MAVSALPGIGFTLTCPDASTIVAVDDVTYGASAVAVPSNCRTIVVYNMDGTNRLFVKFAEAATLSTITLVNSTVIPAGSSMTFEVGPLGQRNDLGGSNAFNLYMLPEAGTNVPVNITYLMSRG